MLAYLSNQNRPVFLYSQLVPVPVVREISRVVRSGVASHAGRIWSAVLVQTKGVGIYRCARRCTGG